MVDDEISSTIADGRIIRQ